MTNADQGRARSALAFLAQTLRPDWDGPGVVSVIEALHRDRQPLGLIARATVDAALTASTKTPGGIRARVRDGFTGAGDVQAATPTAPKLADLRCKKCGGIKPEGDEKHREHCQPRTVPTAEFREAKAKAAGKAHTDTEETTP